LPAKWQQWMPFHIDRFKGSPAVQAMHPAARMGYLYLLSCQWQSDECSISGDAMDLADMSGLGDELWAIHGPRILRNFEALADGMIRNQVCSEEWAEAKRIFDARKASAIRTNTVRSPHGHRVEDERSPSRSADTITGTVTVTKTEEQNKGAKPVAVRFAPPLWVNLATWQDFEAHRGKLRKPMTDRARRDIIAKLETLRARGQDPEAMLAQSIRKGWQDVFEVKEDFSATPKPPAPRPKTQYELATEMQLEERRQAMRAAGVQ
jgi:hypothetical protein